MSDDQPGLDFETTQVEPESPAPVFVSTQERKRREWEARGYTPAPDGPPSGVNCPSCGGPILIDDDFAATLGEHVACFGERE